MIKALLLLAWVPFLFAVLLQSIKSKHLVSISCDAAWELMDIVKNDDVVDQRTENRLLLELRKDILKRC